MTSKMRLGTKNSSYQNIPLIMLKNLSYDKHFLEIKWRCSKGDEVVKFVKQSNMTLTNLRKSWYHKNVLPKTEQNDVTNDDIDQKPDMVSKSILPKSSSGHIEELDSS